MTKARKAYLEQFYISILKFKKKQKPNEQTKKPTKQEISEIKSLSLNLWRVIGSYTAKYKTASERSGPCSKLQNTGHVKFIKT